MLGTSDIISTLFVWGNEWLSLYVRFSLMTRCTGYSNTLLGWRLVNFAMYSGFPHHSNWPAMMNSRFIYIVCFEENIADTKGVIRNSNWKKTAGKIGCSGGTSFPAFQYVKKKYSRQRIFYATFRVSFITIIQHLVSETLYKENLRNVCQWLSAGRWFSPVSSTNKTDHHDTTEIFLKVV